MVLTEEQLTELVNSIVNDYKAKGSIGSDALCDRLDKVAADPDQISEIYKRIEDAHITIVDDYEKDKELYEQLLKEISMDDPVKMYLKE
ncbi:MAG: hypothetical protein J5903_01935, partial [Clostridia bacterium]|nr:hypothetical protein [Clostridia bacterium]